MTRLGLHGISINPVVLINLVPRLYDQLQISRRSTFRQKLRALNMHGKRYFSLNFVGSQTFSWEIHLPHAQYQYQSVLTRNSVL